MSMMDREQDFEARYAHDQELRFRIEARRNKLFGLWAAEKLGKTGEEARLYAQEVIKAAFTRTGDEDVFQKVRKDFEAGGVVQSEHQIRRNMVDFLSEAETQIHKD